MTAISSNQFAAACHAAIVQSFQAQPQQTLQALQTLQQVCMADQLLRDAFQPGRALGDLDMGRAPGCGCIPQPSVEMSGAPAGKGLSKDPAGWPKGSVRTAGGYTIVPEGKQAAWSIYAPGQKPTDKPHTRVWGDPHVQEKDGTKWDFTKNSDFVLPDGTRINAQTTSETGYSVSKGLTITNGADRVNISGIDKNQPQTGPITHDGYEWRAQHLASNPGRDSFHLGGSGDDVRWFRERNNVMEGEIKGAYMDRKSNRYEQVVDNKKGFWVDPNLRPPVGSAAWGNEMRTALTDFLAKEGLPPELAQTFGAFMHADHVQGQVETAMRDLAPYGAFGGLYGLFAGFGQAQNALENLGDAMNSHFELQSQLFLSRARFAIV